MADLATKTPAESDAVAPPADAVSPPSDEGAALLDLAQAADVLGISVAQLNRLRRRGEIPGQRVGWRGWRFRRSDVGAYAARNSGSAEPPSPPAARSTWDDILKIVAELGPAPEDGRFLGEPDESLLTRLANAILVLSIEQGASDIHVEPDRRNLRIRIRVDGVMQQMMTIPAHLKAPLATRYKVMAEMAVEKEAIPQRGCIKIKHGERDYNIRVSTLPSLYGENLVLHVLDCGSHLIGLNKLGIAPHSQVALETLLAEGRGLVLLAGPPNSGLTTTAWGILNKLNNVEGHICTFEEVTEYPLGGVVQTYRSRGKGISTTDAVQALMRHDPNTLFLGDIRDGELAQAAVDAALSGVMTIATISARDSIEAIERLIDFGVDRRQVARALAGVSAQRLIRQICPTCRTTEEVPRGTLSPLGLRPNDPETLITLSRGAGCGECRSIGYRGRGGVFEVLPMTWELRALILRNADERDLRDAARAAGMVPLNEDALIRVLAGITTMQEAMRLLPPVA